MRTLSIISILQILEQNEKEEKEEYQNYKEKLEKKYQTEWIDSEITFEENDTLAALRKRRDEAKDACESFKAHEW